MKKYSLVVINKTTKEEKEYTTVRELSKDFGLNEDTVRRWLKNKSATRTPLAGYDWRVRPYNFPESVPKQTYLRMQEMVDYLLTDFGGDVCGKCIFWKEPNDLEDFRCGHEDECVDGVLAYFLGCGK